MQKQPLILTLYLDEESQLFFNKQRKRYFPPERNFLDAHLTLFHQLPQEKTTLDYLAGLRQSPFALEVCGLMHLGAGVAYRIANTELLALHNKIKLNFADVLSLQDRQPFRPHITIQNKASPEMASALLSELYGSFSPWNIKAHGLNLWAYLGGPWQHVQTIHFIE